MPVYHGGERRRVENGDPNTHTYGQFQVANQPNVHVFGLRQEAPGEKPHRQWEDMQTAPADTYLAIIQQYESHF